MKQPDRTAVLIWFIAGACIIAYNLLFPHTAH